MIPQIIYLMLVMMGLGIHITRHGEDKKPDKYNVWTKLMFSMMTITILYYGGFWDVLIK